MLSCDIEDGFESERTARSPSSSIVHTKYQKKKNQEDAEPPLIDSDLGWNKKVYARTWGCAHNGSDTEIMCGLLVKAGYTLTSDQNEADLWLLNSCTVKTPSETQMDNAVAKAKSLNKHIVVAGCVSQVGIFISIY
jgi:threonylcarbamoyladenosine tRNA methylthiotransferase CDKAL1